MSGEPLEARAEPPIEARSHEPRPGRLRAWWRAARPHTLGASLAPVLVGSAVAFDAGQARGEVAAVCAAVALLMQLATNLANDAYDFLRGIDAQDRIGPPRATQSGWLSARSVLTASAGLLALAALLGVYLVWVGGAPILWGGLASIVAAWSYSGGPFPLASHGLGEVAAFVFFGVVAVCGTSYLQQGAFTQTAVLASLLVAPLVTNLMVVNNLRDLRSDAAAGKRTLPVRIGPAATRRLFTALLLLAYAIAPVLVFWVPGGGPERMLPWITLPWGLRLARAVHRAQSPQDFRDALVRTARLHVATSALLAIGLAA